MNKDFKISFDWEVKTAENTERVGAMYCFKRARRRHVLLQALRCKPELIP